MLAGREAEQAQIGALLDAARAGNGGALLVRGVAGSGKSSLLTNAIQAAPDMQVLRTQGVESESPLAFAALQRLLWPLRERLDALPAPQAAALGAALGQAEGEGGRFLAFLGVLSLLADIAEERPVLAVVDDAHWLDDASAAALLFVARRLQAERIALLFAARDVDMYRFPGHDLPALAVGGLGATAAVAVIAARTGIDVDRGVCQRLVVDTGGNPLALVELAGVLTEGQLSGREPLPAPLPLPGGVERAFLDRYRRLSEQAQRLVLIVAADDSSYLTVIRDAARRGELAGDVFDAALDEAERSGLLSVDGPQVTLHHPLVRSAIYRGATSAQRRAAHRALADALTADPDRATWHLAAAVDQPDETVVAALDGVAERAASRGGHEAAAAAYARASELTLDREARARRLYLAAESSWLGGNPGRATAFARIAEATTDPLLRSNILRLRGQIEWNVNSLDAGYELVLEAVRAAAEADQPLARQLAMLATSLRGWGACSAEAVDPASLAPPLPEGASADEQAVGHLMDGFAAVARTDWAAAVAAFRQAMGLMSGTAPESHFVLQPNLAISTLHVDDDENGLRLHDQQLTTARRSGALVMVEHALTRGFHFQIATGRWSAAANAAAEGLSLASSTGDVGLTALPVAELALMAALRGDAAAADEHLRSVERIRDQHRLGITAVLVDDYTNWARGLVEIRQPAAALARLQRITSLPVRRLAAIDRLETAVRAGSPQLATVWLAEVEQFANATGIPSAAAVLAHGRALLSVDAQAQQHYLAALDAHAHSPRMPNRARTELAFGEYLRRVRRRVDAREHLRAAHAVFEQLGAGPWAERTVQELRASGETARRRDRANDAELTPQERQVATLVRQGLSNRDAASQLFLSPRTVDFHLRNVFAKLGITSRAELAARTLD